MATSNRARTQLHGLDEQPNFNLNLTASRTTKEGTKNIRIIYVLPKCVYFAYSVSDSVFGRTFAAYSTHALYTPI
jgi:hypothetical protein